MALIPFGDKRPQIGPGVFVAESAQVIGDVVLEEGVTVWYNSTVRADLNRITIGRYSNVQDNCVIHTDANSPVTLGESVSMGHGAVVHGATIGNNVLLGINCTILDGVTIGDGSVIGANAFIAEGKEIPPRSLVVGVPGKVVRQLGRDMEAELGKRARLYYELGRGHFESQAAAPRSLVVDTTSEDPDVEELGEEGGQG